MIPIRDISLLNRATITVSFLIFFCGSLTYGQTTVTLKLKDGSCPPVETNVLVQTCPETPRNVKAAQFTQCNTGTVKTIRTVEVDTSTTGVLKNTVSRYGDDEGETRHRSRFPEHPELFSPMPIPDPEKKPGKPSKSDPEVPTSHKIEKKILR